MEKQNNDKMAHPISMHGTLSTVFANPIIPHNPAIED